MKATRANYHDDGRVEIIGTADINFEQQLEYAVSVKKLTDLIGWGKYRAIVRVEYDEINYAFYAIDGQLDICT